MQAHELEQQAIYPQILLSPEAKQAIVVGPTDEVADAANRLFSVGESGQISMNYIAFGTVPFFLRETTDEEMLSYYAALLDRMRVMRHHPNPGVRRKYEWAAPHYTAAIQSMRQTEKQPGNTHRYPAARQMNDLQLDL